MFLEDVCGCVCGEESLGSTSGDEIREEGEEIREEDERGSFKELLTTARHVCTCNTVTIETYSRNKW